MTVLIIIAIIMNALSYFDPSDTTDEFLHQYDIVLGTSMCVTVATSMLATFVIGAQIHASTDTNRKARRRYKHIIEIIIQSSALYSVSLLLNAITALCSPASLTASNSVIFNAGVYTAAISDFTMVYSSNSLFMILDLPVTTSLGIRTHSHGCSTRGCKKQCK